MYVIFNGQFVSFYVCVLKTWWVMGTDVWLLVLVFLFTCYRIHLFFFIFKFFSFFSSCFFFSHLLLFPVSFLYLCLVLFTFLCFRIWMCLLCHQLMSYCLKSVAFMYTFHISVDYWIYWPLNMNNIFLFQISSVHFNFTIWLIRIKTQKKYFI